MSDVELSQRLKAVEEAQSGQELRIAANERGLVNIQSELVGLRAERREDVDRQTQKLDAIYSKINGVAADVALSKGVRRAMMWAAGVLATIVTGLLAAWTRLTGGQ